MPTSARAQIGESRFHGILTHPGLRSKPFILETPVDEEGDDQKDIDALKRLSLRNWRNSHSHMPEKTYDHNQIELKWHERWSDQSKASEGLYKAEENSAKPKYYVLEMLPYPSGALHIGHVRNYSIGDALARYMWMRGYNVLHPMGWDAFGLPAENAAIANHTAPREWTLANIAKMKRTHRRFAFSYDWDREVTTCEPDYYRWNQWFFLRMMERGLAYRKQAMVNWCPECGTVLANEQVVDGCCWRHESTPVEQRALEQWFLKTTAYADELLRDIAQLEGGWPERVLTMQRNWIGRSEGAEVDFQVEGYGPVRVFTTRIDTIYGAPCLIVAPEHEIVTSKLGAEALAAAKKMIDARAQQGPGDIEKEGFDTGLRARSIRLAAKLCPFGWATSCSWDTGPARSWPCPHTTSAISNSAGNTGSISFR